MQKRYTRRGRYKTKLRKKVEEALKNEYGLFRATYLARKIGARVNSVYYQLQQLVKEGVLGRVYKYFVKKADLVFRTVRLAVIKLFRNLKNWYCYRKRRKKRQKNIKSGLIKLFRVELK